ncbi:MAG: hypothetical protein V4665_03540 [Patescibacteria group bacterium]
MYTHTPSYTFITSSGLPVYWPLHDAPRVRTTKKIIERYLSDGQAVFLAKLKALTDFRTPLDEKTENNLTTMLYLMIDARKTWDEENI